MRHHCLRLTFPEHHEKANATRGWNGGLLEEAEAEAAAVAEVAWNATLWPGRALAAMASEWSARHNGTGNRLGKVAHANRTSEHALSARRQRAPAKFTLRRTEVRLGPATAKAQTL